MKEVEEFLEQAVKFVFISQQNHFYLFQSSSPVHPGPSSKSPLCSLSFPAKESVQEEELIRLNREKNELSLVKAREASRRSNPQPVNNRENASQSNLTKRIAGNIMLSWRSVLTTSKCVLLTENLAVFYY